MSSTPSTDTPLDARASALLYAALDQQPTPVALFEGTGLSCLFSNKAWNEHIGPETNIGIPARVCFSAQPTEGVDHYLREALQAGSASMDTVATGQADTRHWHFELTRCSDGEQGILVCASDCTAEVLGRKQQDALDYRLQLLDRVLQSMEEGVMIADADNRIVFTNTAENRMFGYEPDEMTGKHVSILNAYPQAENEQIVDQVTRHLQQVGTYNGAWHNRRKDGTTFFTYSHITVFGSGADTQFICVHRDITQERATLEALQQETKLKQTITDNATGTLFMMNKEGYCTFMNPAGEKMFGYTQEEIRSRPLHDLIHHHRPDGSIYPLEECPIDRALPENYDIRAHEDYFFHKDGTPLVVTCAASPIFENGVPIATVIEVRDITREKAAERALKQSAEELEQKVKERTAELEQVNEQLQQFAYAASHDLQEPLRKMHFFSSRLKDSLEGKLTNTDIGMFERMESATERMRNLIDDLLSYAHTSLGATAFTPVDLNQLVQEVLNDMEVTVLEKKAQVHIGTLPKISGDARQLRQLLQNLLSNALKYARPGEPPQVQVNAEKEASADGGYHRITITDNGIGFEQSEADRIFQIFQRLHGRSEYAGTGVGLAIVRKVVDNHHGTISAKSQPGKGASFVIRLPA